MQLEEAWLDLTVGSTDGVADGMEEQRTKRRAGVVCAAVIQWQAGQDGGIPCASEAFLAVWRCVLVGEEEVVT